MDLVTGVNPAKEDPAHSELSRSGDLRTEIWEQMLLCAALHVKMARTQRILYQHFVAKAIKHAWEDVPHSEQTYTFVVDYGQNMELPVYNKEQPGCTYYYSPLSIYNLGVVNHAYQ